MLAVPPRFMMKSPCVRCRVTRKDIANGEKVRDELVADTKITTSDLLESSKSKTESFEDGNQVDHEEKRECGQEFLRKHLLLTG